MHLEQKIEKQTYNYSNIYNLDYKVNIKQNNFDIEPIVIKRTSSYHDLKSNKTIIDLVKNKIEEDYKLGKIIKATHKRKSDTIKKLSKD